MMFALESEFLIDKGYPDEAVYLCLEGIKMFPNYVAGYTMLAKSYIVLGRLDEALQTIEEAIKKFPRHKTLINFAKSELGIEYEEFNLANFREVFERDEDFVFDLSTKNYRESVKRKFANNVKSSDNDSIDSNERNDINDINDSSISVLVENDNGFELEIPNRKFHNKVTESHQEVDIELIRQSQNIKSYGINLDLNNIPLEYKLDEEIDIFKETNSADLNIIARLFDFKSSNNLIDIVIDNELRFDNFDIGLGYKFQKLEHNFKHSPNTTDDDKLESNSIQNSIKEISISDVELNNKNEELVFLEKLINGDKTEYDEVHYLDNSSNPDAELNENSLSNELLDELSELNEFYQTHPNKNDSLHLEILESIIDNNHNFNLLSEIEEHSLNSNDTIDNVDSIFEQEFKKIVIEEISDEAHKTEHFDFDFDYLDKETNEDAIGIGNLTNQASLELLEESVGEVGHQNYDNLGYENISDISLDNLDNIITNNIELEDIEVENSERDNSELENLDLLSGENHNEDDNFNITEIEENVNLISIDNLEDLLSNHNEISNTKSVDDIPNEITSLEDELQEIVIQEDTVQDEVIQEKKVDILSEVNNRLANAEYSWAEVERLLNENDSKNDNKITTLDETSEVNKEENNEDEIEDEPAQTSMLPVSETLAKIYETQEAYEDSIKIYKKLIIKNPDKADLYNRNIKRIKKIIKKLEKKSK